LYDERKGYGLYHGLFFMNNFEDYAIWNIL